MMNKKFLLPDKIFAFIFLLYISIGSMIVGDYGVNWDDTDQRLNGINNVEYLFHHNKKVLRESQDRYHGPAVEIVLVLAEKVFHTEDFRSIYRMRHKAVFIYMAFSILMFYLLTRMLFTNRWMALLGTLIFILHPRIFAESFYNTKDITVMGGMMTGMLTMVLLSRKMTWPYLLIHALISAWCIDIRVFAVMLPMATVAVLIYKNILIDREPVAKTSTIILLYMVLTFVCMIPMWPILNDSPFFQIGQAIKQMGNYVLWDYKVLFFGHIYKGWTAPGSYQIVWFLITTPVIYSIFFLIGGCLLVRDLFTDFYSVGRNIYIWICLGFAGGPPVAMWVAHSTIYDGWRHVYMIYPFFVLVAVFALDRLVSGKKAMRTMTLLIIIPSLIFNAGMIAYMHPFEYVYFNPLAVQTLRPIDQQFEMDYWGVSCKQGLQYVLDSCYKGSPVNIATDHFPFYENYEMLTSSDQAKLNITDTVHADYFLSMHRFSHDPRPDKLLFEYKRQGNRIVSIYKIK